jgi:hypothetical protein
MRGPEFYWHGRPLTTASLLACRNAKRKQFSRTFWRSAFALTQRANLRYLPPRFIAPTVDLTQKVGSSVAVAVRPSIWGRRAIQ